LQYSVADLQGASRLPSPLDDGLTPSLTALLICDNGTVLWRHRRHVSYVMLNFDRSTVKRGTQNVQNDIHQWLSDSYRVE